MIGCAEYRMYQEIDQFVKTTSDGYIKMVFTDEYITKQVTFDSVWEDFVDFVTFEIGRRGYEFNLQYIEKIKEIKRNIIFPDLGAYRNFYVKSLEEFNIEDGTGLKDIYYVLKKSKPRYRLSLDETHTEFSRCFSKRSLILINYKNF